MGKLGSSGFNLWKRLLEPRKKVTVCVGWLVASALFVQEQHEAGIRSLLVVVAVSWGSATICGVAKSMSRRWAKVFARTDVAGTSQRVPTRRVDNWTRAAEGVHLTYLMTQLAKGT